MLRKTSRGYVLSCSNYSARDKCSYTIWLPRASQEVSVVDGDENVCTRCSTNGAVKKVSFKWKPGDVPAHLGRHSMACILCDSDFREDLQINLPSMDRVRSNGGSNRRQFSGGRGNTSQSSSNRGRGGAGRGRGANSNSRFPRNSGRGSGGTSGVVCFRCQQPGHYANNCPNSNQ